MATAKLYELLVVTGQLATQAETTRKDLRNTFEKKRHHFEEKVKTFTPNTEGAQPVTEEQQDIQTSVQHELRWFAGIASKAMDVAYHIAEGNTRARADVVLDDGTVLLSNVPALALLELEKRVAEIEELVKAVPTLDPAKGFKPDTSRGPGIYRARDVTKTRTKKVEDLVVVIQPTKEHPGQFAKVVKDIDIGTIQEQEWSSLITPAEKGALIERAEEVRRAIKKALHRANSVEMPGALEACGKKIFDRILGA